MIGGKELVLRSTKIIIGSAMLLIVLVGNSCDVFRGNSVTIVTSLAIKIVLMRHV